MANNGVVYSIEVVDRICDEIAKGRSVNNICQVESWAPARVNFYEWMKEHEIVRNKYARAKELSAEYHAEQIVDLTDAEPERDELGKVDSNWTNLQRLRIDARKWTAAKLLPKKYGDKQIMEHTGKITLEQSIAQTINEQKKLEKEVSVLAITDGEE